jgi:hypothetical protein
MSCNNNTFGEGPPASDYSNTAPIATFQLLTCSVLDVNSILHCSNYWPLLRMCVHRDETSRRTITYATDEIFVRSGQNSHPELIFFQSRTTLNSCSVKGSIHDQSYCATLRVVQHDWSCMVLMDLMMNGQTCVAQNNFAQHDWSCMGSLTNGSVPSSSLS